MKFRKSEAKMWARQYMVGVCDSLLPTFSACLTRLDETAIRNDTRRLIDLGFWGAVLISECGTTPDEYVQFMEVAADEAAGRLSLVAQNLTTTNDTLRVFGAAEAIGLDAALIGYPSSFRPASEDEIVDYSQRLIEHTSLASILYSSQSWDFGQLHPAQLSLKTIAKLADLPNVVAIKCEGGAPGSGSIVELVHHLGDRLLVSDSQEFSVPMGVKMYDMQWLGTGNYHYYGDAVVRYFDLLRAGNWDEGMELFWKIHPARVARFEHARASGTHVINRNAWKYQGWLNGFNGGPLRSQQPRIDAKMAESLRLALIKSEIISKDANGDLSDFIRGRSASRELDIFPEPSC